MRKKELMELKKQPAEKLKVELARTREELAHLRLESGTQAQKDTNLMGKKKQRIAVLLTLISEHKLLQAAKKNSHGKST